MDEYSNDSSNCLNKTSPCPFIKLLYWYMKAGFHAHPTITSPNTDKAYHKKNLNDLWEPEVFTTILSIIQKQNFINKI
mgnify:CR=1 FL=1